MRDLFAVRRTCDEMCLDSVITEVVDFHPLASPWAFCRIEMLPLMHTVDRKVVPAEEEGNAAEEEHFVDDDVAEATAKNAPKDQPKSLCGKLWRVKVRKHLEIIWSQLGHCHKIFKQFRVNRRHTTILCGESPGLQGQEMHPFGNCRLCQVPQLSCVWYFVLFIYFIHVNACDKAVCCK